MNDVMERLQAANPVASCEPPPPSVLEFAVSADRHTAAPRATEVETLVRDDRRGCCSGAGGGGLRRCRRGAVAPEAHASQRRGKACR